MAAISLSGGVWPLHCLSTSFEYSPSTPPPALVPGQHPARGCVWCETGWIARRRSLRKHLQVRCLRLTNARIAALPSQCQSCFCFSKNPDLPSNGLSLCGGLIQNTSQLWGACMCMSSVHQVYSLGLTQQHPDSTKRQSATSNPSSAHIVHTKSRVRPTRKSFKASLPQGLSSWNTQHVHETTWRNSSLLTESPELHSALLSLRTPRSFSLMDVTPLTAPTATGSSSPNNLAKGKASATWSDVGITILGIQIQDKNPHQLKIFINTSSQSALPFYLHTSW